MQMKTRSTTRAEEAARLQVCTRSQARAAMAPPLQKFPKPEVERLIIGFKRPNRKRIHPSTFKPVNPQKVPKLPPRPRIEEPMGEKCTDTPAGSLSMSEHEGAVFGQSAPNLD